MRIVCMHTYIEQLNYNYYNIIVNSQLTSKQVYSSCYYYNHNNIRMNVSLVMDMQQKLFLLGSIRFQKEEVQHDWKFSKRTPCIDSLDGHEATCIRYFKEI